MSESITSIPEWKELGWLRHGFSTRRGGVSTVYRSVDAFGFGDLNTGWTAADDPERVAENRRRLISVLGAAKRGFGEDSLVTVRQVHSARTLVVPEARKEFVTPGGKAALEADGLMTSVPGHLLGIQTADCVPVLVVDVVRRVVAAFHAGWRGTAASIVGQGIAQMGQQYGSRPEDLLAAVGPSIGVCCYSVGDEVRETFAKNFTDADELFEIRSGESSGDSSKILYLDLWKANRLQLSAAGIPYSKISLVGECSGCTGLPGSRKYFSHRCEAGFTGRMMSVIGIDSQQ